MKRVNFHLKDAQIERLEAESIRSGLAVAELIRRAIDQFLPEDDGMAVDRFHYKGYTAFLRTEAEYIGGKPRMDIHGESVDRFGGLHFTAETLEQAFDLFKWMVDRRPAVVEAFAVMFEKARRGIPK